jgi:hypothetical protein
VSALASIAVTIVYALGGQVQLEGILLALALGGLSLGLILWAKEMMPGGHYVQERERWLGRVERLHRQPHHHGGILADRIQHDRVVEFGGNHPEDVNAFGFQLL